MRTRVTALAVVPLMLLAAACGSDDGDSSGSGATDTLPGVEITGDFASEPTVTVQNLDVSELVSTVISKGDGPEATKERSTLIQLAVYSGADGKKIFSTWDTKQPLTIGGDAQPLIQGLDKAVDGAPRGSRVALETPAKDAVGEQNVAQLGLKADDALVAVADVLSVEKAEKLDGPDGTPAAAPAGSPKVVETDGKVTGFDWTGVGAKPGEVQVIPLVEGAGPAIEANRLVTFNYFGEVYKAEKPFDESYSKQPLTFPVGAGGLIRAWDKGLIGVKEGSRVLIIAPPADAYGAEGRPPTIPKNATLVFVLDVLGVDG